MLEVQRKHVACKHINVGDGKSLPVLRPLKVVAAAVQAIGKVVKLKMSCKSSDSKETMKYVHPRLVNLGDESRQRGGGVPW